MPITVHSFGSSCALEAKTSPPRLMETKEARWFWKMFLGTILGDSPQLNVALLPRSLTTQATCPSLFPNKESEACFTQNPQFITNTAHLISFIYYQMEIMRE